MIRLYADYLFTEYGDLDCDYVFVNLFARPRGQAWTYTAVYDLVLRLRRRTGIDFDPHWCRHAAATRAQVSGVASAASFGSLCECRGAGLRGQRGAGGEGAWAGRHAG